VRVAVAHKKEASSGARSADTSIKLGPAEWEIAKRIATILYDGTVNDFCERAIVEQCVLAGVIELSESVPLPLPQSASSIEEAVSAAAAFAAAFSRALQKARDAGKTWEKRVLFIRPKTRAHLVRHLATFPAPVVPYEPIPYQPDDEPAPSVTKIRLRPMHMAAAKASAKAHYDGNLSAFIHKALDEKARALKMESPAAIQPSFTVYPRTALLSLQRNIEEPALALIAGLEQLAPRIGKAPHPGPRATSELLGACSSLFEALLGIVPNGSVPTA
jgi:hypothetical protein